ncbi:hypothetical protein V492_08521 [Pseudogymnoascus sp. VKM F-4246]|nr:hypothetical protein V492_08521 [Pseudogymnoascus sp. VKM F-4246]
MGASAIQDQRDIIVGAIKNITRGDWKVLVVDTDSKRILDNVVKEDDILNENIANIEKIEDKRPPNPDMDAIYFLSPESHIVDCLMADFSRRRYKKSYLMWTALLDPTIRRRIDNSAEAQQQLAGFETLSIDYFPRESRLVTFRDPWSFPILYHPACNNVVAAHMQTLAQKIAGVCISLGEYPIVRYYKPKAPTHEASVLCSHLARFVQDELDAYAKFHTNFPPPSNRQQGVLIVTDRSMDLFAPLIHEFTYQAMAHDLLPIREGDKVLYKTVVNQGEPGEEEKDMEIGENDDIWVKNRHTHMKDTIERLMGDFQKFISDNPHFTNQSGDATSLNAIKDMLAGLPQFQNLKDAYSLHLSMAQECMNIFQNRKLPDIASVEQSLATGLDEDYRKPKNLADQVIRLLDDESISSSDRLRLIALYIIYSDGIVFEDIPRLMAHASLPSTNIETVTNLELLGARTTRPLKETRHSHAPLFPRKTAPTAANEDYALSRFEPALKLLLEEICRGPLDPALFPYTKPPMQGDFDQSANVNASLRSAKPTWAQNRRSVHESKQRVIVFMAGGATYSESRACYETTKNSNRDVMLVTSHMLTPALFLRQVTDLSVDRRQLDLPADRPKKKAPQHLFERPTPSPSPSPQGGLPSGPAGGRGGPSPRPPLQSSQNSGSRKAVEPPSGQMGAMSLNSGGGPNGSSKGPSPVGGGGKLEKKTKYDEDGKEKKKRGFFSSKK